MASYKVAQDVEADDKLLGPFSFRQFIYLIIVAMGLFIAYGFWKLLPPLAIIPLPVVLFFGALALPLRKDQPMETYLAAIVSFYLKPRRRLWEPDGIQSLVEVSAPKTTEDHRTKDLSESEAENRLSYLANLADTRGWSIRNVNAPTPLPNTSMVGDIYNEAVETEDILDDQGYAARSFETMINAADTKRRQDMIERLHQPSVAAPTPATPPPTPMPMPAPEPADPQNIPTTISYNPYPTDMNQSVIQPMSSQPPAQQTPQPQAATPIAQPVAVNPEPPTSAELVSPDIINLANNSDLSIETIAHEADRLQHKHKKLDDGEVMISLR